MTNAPDYPDYTTQVSRFMAQLAQSPLSGNTAGWQSVVCDVPLWARTLNLLVSGTTNVISLSITGVTTGFIYLNAMPAYDGGIYYIPAMPVVDTQVTVRWYQVTATLVNIYAIASDEPISISVFNPVSPTQSTSERLVYGGPVSCTPGITTGVGFQLDTTTNALRCTVDTPANYLWGKVRGDQSGTLYYDGSGSNAKFPTTPIPIDRSVDTSVTVTVLTTNTGTVNLYIAAVNSPDFAASVPLVHGMSPNELAPDAKQSATPNLLPAIYDGTIAASGNVVLSGANAAWQMRVHAISIMQYTAVATAFDLEDTSSVKFFHYHYGAAMNSIYVPLFGQLALKGQGLRLHNTTAVLSGAVGVTLWFSVL